VFQTQEIAWQARGLSPLKYFQGEEIFLYRFSVLFAAANSVGNEECVEPKSALELYDLFVPVVPAHQNRRVTFPGLWLSLISDVEGLKQPRNAHVCGMGK
jgi:hypothetical protein